MEPVNQSAIGCDISYMQRRINLHQRGDVSQSCMPSIPYYRIYCMRNLPLYRPFSLTLANEHHRKLCQSHQMDTPPCLIRLLHKIQEGKWKTPPKTCPGWTTRKRPKSETMILFHSFIPNGQLERPYCIWKTKTSPMRTQINLPTSSNRSLTIFVTFSLQRKSYPTRYLHSHQFHRTNFSFPNYMTLSAPKTVTFLRGSRLKSMRTVSLFEPYKIHQKLWSSIALRIIYFKIATIPYWQDIPVEESYTTRSVSITIGPHLPYIVIQRCAYACNGLGTWSSWEEASETWSNSRKTTNSNPCVSTYWEKLSAHRVENDILF